MQHILFILSYKKPIFLYFFISLPFVFDNAYSYSSLVNVEAVLQACHISLLSFCSILSHLLPIQSQSHSQYNQLAPSYHKYTGMRYMDFSRTRTAWC